MIFALKKTETAYLDKLLVLWYTAPNSCDTSDMGG